MILERGSPVNDSASESMLSVRLEQLRLRLGLSLHAMAELLYTSQQTYRSWEKGSTPRRDAQERIERFLTSAGDQLAILEEHNVDLSALMPLNLVSSRLGVPHETLFHAYRERKFPAFDLGILGIWIVEDDLDVIMDAVLA
jgi:transcriptional regulator with XRE-family HTH domain